MESAYWGKGNIQENLKLNRNVAEMEKKYIYIGYCVPKENEKDASGLSVAGNKMQLNIIQELSKYSDMQLYPITIYPCASYSKDKRLIYKKNILKLCNSYSAIQVGFINIPIGKQMCQIIGTFFTVKSLVRKFPDAEIITFNMYPQVGTPAKWIKKIYGNRIVSIVADLPIAIEKKKNIMANALMSIFNAITKKNLKNVDKAIVLNENAVKYFLATKSYIVVEGGIEVSPCEKNDFSIVDYVHRESIIVYSGALVEYNGIYNLIQAMKLVQADVTLRIYGDGPLRGIVEEAAREQSKIEYMGVVSNEQMMQLQRQAYILINPRPVDDPISKVTFPSKIFEYLMSGTVVMTTKLSGFTNEYLDKMFFMDDDPRSIADEIDKCMQIPYEKMNDMAVKAHDFVVEEKSWEIQGKKIHDFLVEM